LSRAWSKSGVEKSEDADMYLWSFTKVFSDKIEEEVISVMGRIGSLGLYIESSLFNVSTL